MKYNLLFLLLLSVVLSTFAQHKHDFIWKTGYGDFISPKKYKTASILDFNFDPVKVYADSIRVSLGSANAAICDPKGQLICYSGGYWLESSDAEIVEGSKNLINHAQTTIKTQLDSNGLFGSPQGILMLPTPEKENREFFVFNFAVDTFVQQMDDFAYTKVAYQGKILTVLEKCKLVTSGKTFYSAYVSACRHGNGRDWWIFAVEVGYAKAHLFLFTKDGIIKDVVLDLNVKVEEIISDGVTNFSIDGKKLIMYSISNGIWLFDFDRCNGAISNLQTIPVIDQIKVPNNLGRGLACSLNNRLLYASNARYLYQYDLSSKDIGGSRIVLAEVNAQQDTFRGALVGFSTMQLAPDGKIYMSNLGALDYMHTIDNPDVLGEKCNFRRRSLPLPTYQAWALPNYPNYRLGVATGSSCDTLNSMAKPDVVLIFPNPYVAGDLLTIQKNTNTATEFVLYDITGRLVYRTLLQPISGRQTIQLPHFAVGNYVWKVGTSVGKLQIF
jgi:hypothetical protein